MRKISIVATIALSTLALGISACDQGTDANKEVAKTGDAKTGDAKDGDAKDGDAKDSDAKDSDAKDGDAKDGDAKEGDTPAGDPLERALAAVEAYNAADYDKSLSFFATDVKLNFAGVPESVTGSEAIKKQWELGRVAFPDSKVAIATAMVSGDIVALHMVSDGIHKGDYMGTAATDKPVGSELLYLMRDEGGKFVEATIYSNPMDISTQIGAAPEGVPPVPVPEMPSGDPVVIQGEPSDANLEVVKGWYATFSDGTTADKVGDFLAENAKHHNAATGEHAEGLETAKKNIAEMTAANTNIELRDLDLKSAGDFVLATGIWAGKNTGDMGPIKATNKEFALDFAEILLVKDGKIAESWEFHNPVQMMTQLGLMPEAPKKEGAPAPKEEVAAK